MGKDSGGLIKKERVGKVRENDFSQGSIINHG